MALLHCHGLHKGDPCPFLSYAPRGASAWTWKPLAFSMWLPLSLHNPSSTSPSGLQAQLAPLLSAAERTSTPHSSPTALASLLNAI